ncbi:MAG TPA: CapA family protein [Steroidobacteraceae bacterium]|nr:CapA family protein [Steroidobacteraceae bacterium]
MPPPPKGITFAAVGDVMLGTDYPSNILPDDDGVGCLANVGPVLSAADVAFGNLEGVLMDGGEAVKRCKPPRRNNAAPVSASGASATSDSGASSGSSAGAAREPALALDESAQARGVPADRDAAANDGGAHGLPPAEDAGAGDQRRTDEQTPAAEPGPTGTSAQGDASTPSETPPQSSSVQPPPTAGSCYVFRSPTRYATYLRDAGFDVMSLANNHAQDFGDAGRDSTMRALDDVGIRHSGRDGDVAEWMTTGRRFALVAFAPNIGSHQLNDLERAREIVAHLAANHDIVVVSFHGGSEGEGAATLPFAHEIYQGEDRGDVVEFAHAVVDAGADLVLGSGPHVLRAIELYRDRLIAYSLGNFATYYGISVSGVRGIAGILTTRLDDDGRFLDARLDSTIQLRPAGPALDPERRAVALLRELTTAAFPTGQLMIEDDGRVVAVR